MDRRHFLKLSATTAAVAAGIGPGAAAGPISALGIDATHYGVRPGSPDDQSLALQRAVDAATAARTPLALPPGNYRAGDLKLGPGTQIVGVRGATRIILGQGRELMNAAGADGLTLSGLVLDGGNKPLTKGLLSIAQASSVRITDCEIIGSGGHGILLEAVAGEISGTMVSDAAEVAILSYHARGLVIARNVIRGAGNNGIQILRWENGDDGTIIVDNRVEDIGNRSGGSGQFGNGINAHRASNVIVRGNRVRGCAFSAVRGNTASNIQIVGNTCSDLGEVALYSEFAFEGAVIADNIVERAAIGVSVCNFNEGGRLAVVQGNIIRNLTARRPAGTDPGDAAGIGIYVEADTAVTGNVVEAAPSAGIMLGWGPYLRDVSVTGNVVRASDIGIAVSVVAGAGAAVINDNLISGATRGAIVGVDKMRLITGDLAHEGAARFAQLAISGNRVR
ncbi:MAG: TIGR03808 family TAT-translocated repetitive protein [Xanthobacteraceae bacterium]